MRTPGIRWKPGRLRLAGAVALGLGLSIPLSGDAARADPPEAEPRSTPTAAIAAPGREPDGRVMLRRTDSGQGGSGGVVSGSSRWLLTGGVAVALVGLGAASLGTGRRGLLAGREAGDVRIVGRVQLTPKHAVHLLRAGDRTLIVGTGQGGPPALLGELSEPLADSPGIPSERRPVAVPTRLEERA